MTNFARDTSSKTFTISGTIAVAGKLLPITGSGALSSVIAAGTFEGMAAQVKTITTTGTLVAQDTSAPVADTAVSFYDSNFNTLGSSSANSYCVGVSPAVFPASVKVGDAGDWYTANCYTDSTKSVKTASAVISYTIEPLTDTTAILKLSQKSTPLNGSATVRELTYTLSNGGVVTPRETPFVGTVSGVSVNMTFKFF